MNKRLRQFEKESGIELYALGKDREKWEDTLSKFAELLIKECLDQCYNKGMNDSLYEGQLKAASYIEQHFGVE